MQLNFDEAAESDKLEKTINYEDVYRITRQEMEVHARLIEHVCKRILDSIKQQFPQLTHIKVRISKHHPPLKGHVERVFTELEERVG